jgi:uncharacterized protein (TIGR02453 family)
VGPRRWVDRAGSRVGGGLDPRWRDVLARASDDASEHPADVDIDGTDLLPERDGSDRSRGVWPDSWESLELVDRVGDAAAVVVTDRARGTPQGEGAPVVAETLPLAQDVGGCRLRERVDARETGHEPFPVGRRSVSLGLLGHRLGDEDGIWVGSAAERKISSVDAIPAYERGGELGRGGRRIWNPFRAHGSQDSGGEVADDRQVSEAAYDGGQRRVEIVMAIAVRRFTGFRPEAIDFLAELAQNNDRAWFQPRKAEYERLLKEPMEEFVAGLADAFDELGLPLQADPKRSIFRIYRDTRFAKDKSPYKTHLGASFPWVADMAPDSEISHTDHANGAYFHLQPGNNFAGGGMWQATKPRLDAFRDAIVTDEPRVRTALEDPAFLAEFGPVESHDSLKRVPPGYPQDHAMADMFRFKDLVFGRRLSDDEVYSPDLPRILAAAYAKATPVFSFLASLDA